MMHCMHAQHRLFTAMVFVNYTMFSVATLMDVCLSRKLLTVRNYNLLMSSSVCGKWITAEVLMNQNKTTVILSFTVLQSHNNWYLHIH